MKTHVLSIALLVLAGPALAAEVDHGQMDHSKMGHGPAAAVKAGPWSYKGRDNPRPHTRGRWEMVPVPGYGHMFISTQGLSRELKCAALDNPGVMVDRATRQACGLPEAAIPAKPAAGTGKPAAPAAAGHGGH